MIYSCVDHSATELREPIGKSDVDLTSTRYAEELQAIGQALEGQGRFVSVEIEAQDSGYWVRAESDESTQAEESFGTILKRTFQFLLQKDSRSVERRYSANEIQKMIQLGQARRRVTNGAPDPFSLAQILHVAGSYINELGQTTLIGVVVKDRSIIFRYNQIKESQHDIQFVHNYSIKKYLHRKFTSQAANSIDSK